jgi:hypothetical protein
MRANATLFRLVSWLRGAASFNLSEWRTSNACAMGVASPGVIFGPAGA